MALESLWKCFGVKEHIRVHHSTELVGEQAWDYYQGHLDELSR